MKVDTQAFGVKSLLSLINMNNELRSAYVETDTWEDMLPRIDQVFNYTDEQLEYVKKDFLKRRGS